MLPSRGGWTLAGLAALNVWFLGPDAVADAEATVGPDFPQALLGLGSLAQLAISAWVLLIITVAHLGGTSRAVGVITPWLLRRALFVSAAGALALTPAQADRGSSRAHETIQDHALDGLRLPDRPSSDIGDGVGVGVGVIVRPGDTLWAIAARSLDPAASDAEIARACATWYAANRKVIGNDPDLIHPSQRLTPPATTPPTKDAS